MARFVIHVGPHKTGTTYLQRCLDQNAAAFRRQGIIVPTEWRDSPENPSHTGLVRPIRQGRAADLAGIFNEWRRLPDALIALSSETIFECNDDELQALRDLLSDADYTIVYYIRRWSELIMSSWSELMGQGWTMPFPEYVLGLIENPAAVPAINADINLARLARVFGKDRIKVTSYNSVLERGGDIFKHFARHHLGRPDYAALAATVINPSVSPVESELRRALNVIDQTGGGQQRSARMASHLARRRGSLDLSLIYQYLERFTRYTPLDDTRPAIAAILTKNRQDYAMCATPPVPRDLFYSAQTLTAPFIGQDYALAPGVAETLMSLRDELLR
jgi:hypothetical protein